MKSGLPRAIARATSGALNRLVAAFIVPVVAAAGLGLSQPAAAAGGGYPLDTFPVGKLDNLPALQNGAKLFVNYCLGCHSTSAMRYNRLQDIGLTPEQIKDNLMFTGTKVGDPMNISMTKTDAKNWFGAAPPDLSVITRARSSGDGSGSDWVYTFLRSFYRDSSTATGWNNALFPNVGMPHVLWQLQGSRKTTVTEVKAHGDHGFMQTVATYDNRGTGSMGEGTELSGHPHVGKVFRFETAAGGQQSAIEYDNSVADLVAYMTYVSDPTAKTRTRLGMWVLIFLSILFIAAWMLNRAYWKDIK